jgi:uncharacterized membrane protein
MQAAFSSQENIVARTNGALFVGTPHDTPLWLDIERNRDEGSPQWQPTYKNGTVVRFASTASDLSKIDSSWNSRKVVYLQHASDPIPWWSPSLIFSKPDWLQEPRGPDVSSNFKWYPISTFLNLSVDQFSGGKAQDGHGHNYSTAPVGAWAAIVPPAGWDAEKTTELEKIVATYTDK